MKSLLMSIAGAALLLLTIAGAQATAQDDQNNQNGWYQQRENYYHGEGWHARFFERVRLDLDHVQALDFSGADQDRIVDAKHMLGELQRKYAEGRYDQPQLDEAIVALRRVVADNSLPVRDRGMLTDDLNRLRDYRAHHEQWQ